MTEASSIAVWQDVKHNPDVRRRVYIYLAAGFAGMLLVFGTTLLDPALYTNAIYFLHPINTFSELLVGLMLLLRFRRDAQGIYLWLGVAILAAGMLDLNHAVLLLHDLPDSTSLSTSDATVEQIWSWTSGRLAQTVLLLGGILIGTLLADQRTTKRNSNWGQILAVSGAGLLTASALYYLNILYSDGDLDVALGVMQFGPASIYLLDLILLLIIGYWRRDVFQHWLIIAICFNVAAELTQGLVFGTQPGEAISLGSAFNLLHLSIIIVGLHFSTATAFDELQNEVRDRKKAEELKNVSDTMYRSILLTMPDGLIVLDRLGQIREFNPSAEMMYDCTKADVLGQNINMLLTKPLELQSGESFHEFFDSSNITMLDSNHEVEAKRPDGSTFRMEMTLAQMFVGGERLFSALIRDTSSRWQNEEVMKRRERLLSVTGSLARVGGWEVNLKTQTILWSDECFHIHGLPPGEPPELTDAINFYHPDDRGRVVEFVERVGQSDEAIEMEARLITANKEEVYVRVFGQALKQDGQPFKIFGAIQDITAIQKIKSEQQHFFDISLDLICILTPEGLFRQLSPAWEEVLGWSGEDLLTRNFLEKVHPDDFEVATRVQVELAAGRDVTNSKFRFRCKNGSYRWVAWRSRFDEKLHLVFAIARDISEDQLKEQALVKARLEAESAVKIKNEFLASMSHEIRTPMNAIISMSELMLDTKLSADQRELATMVSQSAEALLNIINDILDFSKMEAGKLKIDQIDFQLKSVIDSVANLLKVQAREKSIEFTANTSAELDNMVTGDPLRLRQILTNLLNNAIKFTEVGSVSLRCLVLPIEIDNNLRVRFEVADTGIGIPEDACERIFTSFAQVNASTTRQHGGTGLGLTISKELVELMGGKIGFESKLHQGSTFWFELVFELSTGKDFAELEQKLRTALKGKHVVLIDDNQQERSDLTSHFERWGAKVCSFENHEAIETTQNATNNKSDFVGVETALVVINSECYDFNHLEAKLLKNFIYSGAQILILCDAEQRAAIEQQMPQAGIVGKPIKIEALLHNVHELMQRRELQAPPLVQTAQSPTAPGVLLVEDNPVNQKVAMRMLKKIGITPDCCFNGREALQAIEKKSYQLILMDCQMPVMDGYEATREIRKREKNGELRTHTIIALTANAMADDRDLCIEAGMDDYISKPAKFHILRQVIMHWIQKPDRHSRDEVAKKAL